jgi:RNA polymerase sigma-70 factor, ECF subfamily
MAGFHRARTIESPLSVDLQELIDAHGDRLLRSAYLLCGDKTEAQDLAQETLLQAYKSARRFRGDSAVYTWLYGILRNLCYRHLRKQKRLVLGAELPAEEAIHPSPGKELDQDYRATKLSKALQGLSPIHREMIALRFYENLKIHEIASRTGLSDGTVKSRLHYAVRRLKELLPSEMNLFAADDTQEGEIHELPRIQ